MTTLTGLDPKRDIGLIRERLSVALQSGGNTTDLLHEIAEKNPIALADLVVGPKALRGDPWVRAAMEVVDALETAIAPSGLYSRLVSLGDEAGPDILHLAARRHPSASWLITLSRKIEGQEAGRIHLLAAAGHPAFAQNCWAHAAAGHLPGLVAVAAETGRPEPAAALAANGHLDAAGLALVSALEHTPDSPVVATIAAAWGPDVRPVLNKSLAHLRSRQVALTLLTQARGYPSFCSLLDTVIKAMVHR